MHKKIIIGLSTLALSLSLIQVPLAYACPKNDCAAPNIEKITKQLDLTTEQQQKIIDIRDKMKPQIAAKRQEMRNAHKQLDSLVRASTLDEGKLDAAVAQTQEIFGALLKLHVMERRAIADVLTDAQKKKLHMMMQKKEHHDMAMDHKAN